MATGSGHVSDRSAPRATRGSRAPRPGLGLLGAALATVGPAAQVLVAFLWSNSVISPDPNGAFVQALQAVSTLQFVLAPLGIAVVGIGARLARPRSWIALYLVTFLPLAALWFVGAAWLGGLAGEPF